MAHDLVTELLQYSSLACFMPIWQLCANLLIPNCLRSNLSYSPLAALELYVKIFKKGEFYGKTGHTGNGLFYAKMYIDDFLKDSSISLMPATEKCSIGFEIIISK